jgi:hypothetical protein
VGSAFFVGRWLSKEFILTVGGPMAREIGTWWIKDGIDGRRIEATGFW